jgi:uncharacterized membrane protein
MELSKHEREERLLDLEERIARILRIGVIIAASLMGAGLAMALAGFGGLLSSRLMLFGLIVLVGTPIFRVMAALVAYLWAGDKVYAIISAIVLAIIAVGALLGNTH